MRKKAKTVSKAAVTTRPARNTLKPYLLEKQLGFILRQVTQRHTMIFAARMSDSLTPTQFSALVKLYSETSVSQNLLGRLTAMDSATIKGVIDRLVARGYVEVQLNPEDSRVRLLNLTPLGRSAVERALPFADAITSETLAPLTARDRAVLIRLLRHLC